MYSLYIYVIYLLYIDRLCWRYTSWNFTAKQQEILLICYQQETLVYSYEFKYTD